MPPVFLDAKKRNKRERNVRERSLPEYLDLSTASLRAPSPGITGTLLNNPLHKPLKTHLVTCMFPTLSSLFPVSLLLISDLLQLSTHYFSVKIGSREPYGKKKPVAEFVFTLDC